MKSSFAVLTLVVASIGMSAAAPAFAQSAPSSDGPQIGLSLPDNPPATPSDGDQVGLGLNDPDGMGGMFDARAMMPGRAMGPGALLMLACSPRGAEALDVALLHLSYRLDLTADQKPLFDTFREKALTSETTFSDTCKSDAPTATAGAKPDFLDRFKARLAIDQARLTALNDVLPSFEALYATLTDTQKAALLPQGGWGGMHHWGNQDMGRMVRPPMPGRS